MHVTGADADTAGLVGVRRADALQGGTDLVVAAHRLGDRIVRLMPREDEVSTTRHLQLRARIATRFEHVDFGEQRRQIDDHPVGDHRDHMVVQNPRGDELKGVFLTVDDHRVPGVVPALVADDERVLLREQIDDFGFAFIAPLGSDDDGDGHARSCATRWLERDEILLARRATRQIGSFRLDIEHDDRPTERVVHYER